MVAKESNRWQEAQVESLDKIMKSSCPGSNVEITKLKERFEGADDSLSEQEMKRWLLVSKV